MAEYALIVSSSVRSAFASLGNWTGHNENILMGLGVVVAVFVIGLLTFRR